jgi:hypothetical protein
MLYNREERWRNVAMQLGNAPRYIWMKTLQEKTKTVD